MICEECGNSDLTDPKTEIGLGYTVTSYKCRCGNIVFKYDEDNIDINNDLRFYTLNSKNK